MLSLINNNNNNNLKQLSKMRNFLSMLVMGTMMVSMLSCSNSEVKRKPEVNITTVINPSDGLDLKLVGGLLQEGKVTDAKSLEMELNKEGGINNLDLNSDKSVDFINVSENESPINNVKSFDLTTGNGEDVTHIASIEVEQNGSEYNINMSGSEQLYGDNRSYQTSYRPSTGQLLFYAWLFSPRPYYYHRPYYRGHYPTYYGSRVVVNRSVYRTRTSSQRVTANKTVTKSTTPSKVKSKNSGKISSKARSSVNNHNKQNKQMKSRSTSKEVKKGGFTKSNTKPKSTTTKPKSTTTKPKSTNRSSSRSSSSRSSSRRSSSRRSDSTFKTNISDYEGGLDIVMNLNSVYYNWKPNFDYIEVVGMCYDDDDIYDRQLGFIAQEVEVLVPEVVNTDNYGKTVDYDLLVPVLVSAIQNQQRQIDSLKSFIKQ